MDHTDSLEDWVAVKCNAFTDTTIAPQLKFLVSWNDVEKKVSISCRLNTRTITDTEEQHCRSGCFTWSEIRCAHQLLCLVHPSLIPHLPRLPDDGWGLWAYITTQQTPNDIDDICADLQQYFEVALEICKERLLMSVLFEEHSPEDYFENVSELRYRSYVQAVENAEEELKSVTDIRDSCTTMFDITDIYSMEDEVMYKLNISLAELYNYQLQPFLDMRELAKSKLRVAKAELECEHLGDRRKKEAAEVISEWQGHYEQALDSTQQLYIAYYKHTSNVLRGMRERMLEDQKRFGKNAFDMIGAERLLRIEEDYYSERLQLLANMKMLYTHERDKVKEEIASMSESSNVQERLSECEHTVYDWQVKIYDMQLEIAGEEDVLYKTQLNSLTRPMKSKDEHATRYDALDDPSAIVSSDDEDETVNTQLSARIFRLQQNISRVNRTRAKIRARKASLISQAKGRERERLDEEHRHQQHHAIQQKRDEQKTELLKKQDMIQDEREKTIKRLKNYKMKYPTPVTIKPPRYQPPSQRTTKQPSPDGRVILPEKKKALRRSGNKSYHDIPTSFHGTTKDSPDGASVCTSDASNTHLPSPPACLPVPLPPPPPPPPPPPLPPPPPRALVLSFKDARRSLRSHSREDGEISQEPNQKCPPTSQPSLQGVVTQTSLAQATKMLKSVHDRELKPRPTDLGPPKLDSILLGRKNLHSATEDRQARRILPPKDPVDDIMSMIRSGVVLRPVAKSDDAPRPRASDLPSDSHLDMLRQRLSQINDITAGSSSESDNDFDFDD